MSDPHSSTSSPFWKTTSQPQSHSTSQGTTSRLGDWVGELWLYREVQLWRSKLGTTEKFSKAADALLKLQRKRFYKLVHNHTGTLANARKKVF